VQIDVVSLSNVHFFDVFCLFLSENDVVNEEIQSALSPKEFSDGESQNVENGLIDKQSQGVNNPEESVESKETVKAQEIHQT